MTTLAAQMKPMFTRMEIAQTNFIANVMDQFKFTEAEAEKILRIYRKVKAVRYDAAMGRYNLTHGAYWEKQPMLNALAVKEKS